MNRLGITVGLEGIPPSEMVALAQAAESAGYSDAWSAEVGGVDGLIPLGAVAAATSKVRLGSGILPVFSRPPALLAMSAATLQSISHGRFVLGLGTSTPIIMQKWMGLEFDRPLVRMRETVEVLREALAGKKVTYEGETVSVDGFRLQVDPGAEVPIYLAGLGPKMLELAGRIADGVMLFLFTPDGVRQAMEHVRAGAKAAGRDPDEIDVVARIAVAIDEEEEMLRFMLRRLTTSYVMVPTYNASLKRQGFENEAKTLAERWGSGDREGASEAVSDEMLEGLYIFGDAQRCREKLAAFRQAGVKTPVLFPASVAGDPSERSHRVKRVVETMAGA